MSNDPPLTNPRTTPYKRDEMHSGGRQKERERKLGRRREKVSETEVDT